MRDPVYPRSACPKSSATIRSTCLGFGSVLMRPSLAEWTAAVNALIKSNTFSMLQCLYHNHEIQCVVHLMLQSFGEMNCHRITVLHSVLFHFTNLDQRQRRTSTTKNNSCSVCTIATYYVFSKESINHWERHKTR